MARRQLDRPATRSMADIVGEVALLVAAGAGVAASAREFLLMWVIPGCGVAAWLAWTLLRHLRTRDKRSHRSAWRTERGTG